MKTRRLHAKCLAAAAAAAGLLALGGVSAAFGQDAYFSLQGNFGADGSREDFNIALSRSVSSVETLEFQTFARNGGTNAAGDSFAANPTGTDSVLEVFDSANQSRGFNDDR